MIAKAKTCMLIGHHLFQSALAIYIYGRGFCLVISSTRHARIRIHVQNRTRVHISACPIKLVTELKPNPIYIT